MKINANKLVHTKNLTRKEWLEYRQSGIGGSDAASISQLNKYSSPRKVYMEKVEAVQDQDETNEAMEWGNRHEPTIREKFKENHPELTVRRSLFMWQSEDHPFMLANVDGLLYHPEKGWGILEIKTANEFKNDAWDDEVVPEEYLIQMQHYQGTMKLNWGYFAVLVGGNKYREFYIERDEELIESLIMIEADFWNNHVIPRIQPELDGSTSSADILMQMYPGEDAYEKKEIKQLPEEALELIKQHDEYKESIEMLQKEFNEVKHKLQEMMGEHQIGKAGDREVKWSVSRSFNEQKLKEAEPELYKSFTTMVLDKKEFKKHHKEVYENFMLPKSRNFSIK